MDAPAERIGLDLEAGAALEHHPDVAGMRIQFVTAAFGERTAELHRAADRVPLDPIAGDILNGDRSADAADIDPARGYLANGDAAADAAGFDHTIRLCVDDLDIT